MIARVEQPIAIACIFIWIGFVCAISLLEAWHKFRARGAALPIGMNIGPMAFKTLNKIEWVCAGILIVTAIMNHTTLLAPENIYLLVGLAVLIAQTFWLLPKRDARAARFMNSQSRPPTNLHIYFIAAEVLKVICLGAAGVSMVNAV